MKKIDNMRTNTKGLAASFCFLLSAFSFLVSCSQEEILQQETDADAVRVVASISNLQTRVAYEDNGATNFINGDEICVQNTLRETKNIATYTFDGTTWTTTDAFVWNGSAKNQFKAWLVLSAHPISPPPLLPLGNHKSVLYSPELVSVSPTPLKK